jgi:8-oxo-dGTP pyrophosphatase MutT (NUDIX family)
VTADVPVRPAATVVVLRDTPAGIEVFMVRRHQGVAFMAGSYVFPGGRVDVADYSADPSWCDGVAEAGSRMAGLSTGDVLAFHVAAARELFEEAGVLLARGDTGAFASFASADAGRRRERLRTELHDGRRGFRDVVEGERLRLALDALVLFAHWVTPPCDTRRFDTRFFAACAPAQQSPAHDGQESTAGVWVRPADALAGVAAGDMALPPPTWATLREIEQFVSVDAALRWARLRRVYRREPRLTEDAGVRRLVLPGDATFPEPDPVAYETQFVLKEGRWRPEPAA